MPCRERFALATGHKQCFSGAAGRRLGADNQNPHQTVYPSIRITRLSQSPPDSGESLIEANVVRSPAFSPGIGSSRAVSGLRSAPASAASSSSTPTICSAVLSPGSGMVSRPVPQTALKASRSRSV